MQTSATERDWAQPVESPVFQTPAGPGRTPICQVLSPRGDSPAVVVLPPPTLPQAATTLRPDVLPTIPGYEVLGELGRGGMGVVYKAVQLGLNRVVALKMILGGPLAAPEYRARFQAEAEAVARLQHPNIVQVFATGTHTGPLGEAFACPFFAQEYVDGGTLAGRLHGAPQPARVAARFIETLARAVHYAHERGIVHRDLKPANILLKPAENSADRSSRLEQVALSAFAPKIGDFGLAKQLGVPTGNPTATSVVLGTPEYMAPEQAAGGGAVGPAADVYALGIILYELMTGRRPFEGPTPVETIEQVRFLEPVAPRRWQPRLPRDLETICLQCIRKEPARRYASARALADDLHRFLAGEPIQARPVGTAERAWRWARRRPELATLAAVLVLTAVAGAVGVTAAWLHALAGWNQADRLRHAAVARHEEAESRLYVSRVTQARLERQLNNLDSAAELLERCRPADDDSRDRRGWEWYYLRGLLHGDLLTIPEAHKDSVFDLLFSPDGNRLLSAGGSPFRPQPPDRVCIWQVSGTEAGRCLREFPHPRFVRRAAFSPDGQQVAWAGSDGAVCLGEAANGKVAVRRQLPQGFEPAFLSADGQRYAAARSDGTIRVWELATGRELCTIRLSSSSYHFLTFSPDGGMLAIRSRSALGLWDVATGHEIRFFPQAEEARSRPTFSRDGKLLALGTNNGLVRIWDVATGRLVQSPAGHAGGVLCVAFRPDGERLASAGADGTVRLWNVRTGAELLLFRGHAGRVSSLAFHPSGHYLASGGEQPVEVKIWDLTRPQEYLTIPASRTASGRPEALAFSSDGRTVLTARISGRLQISDTATGVDREVKPIDLWGAWMGGSALAAIRADGAQLATVSRQEPHIVKLTDVPSGREELRLKHAHEVYHLAYSTDGRRLASLTAGTEDGPRDVCVWDVTTGECLLTVSAPKSAADRAHAGVALNPAGTLLAHAVADGDAGAPASYSVQIRDAVTGTVRRTVDGLPAPAERLTFSPDGRLLAISCYNEGIRIFDGPAGRWLHERPLGGSTAQVYADVAFSPDGRRLAAAGRVQVLLWDVESGERVLTLRGAPPRPSDNGFNARVAWSPDGRRLAASNWNASLSIWDAAERETPETKRALHEAAEARARQAVERDDES